MSNQVMQRRSFVTLVASAGSGQKRRSCSRPGREVSWRLGKTAVHELGHTFGLEHCPSRGCLMHDGDGTVLTTDAERDFCAGCRGKLAARGFLRANAQSPWG